LEGAGPETIVIASPHNLRLRKHLGVVVSENCSGKVSEGAAEVSLSAKCDLELGDKILQGGERLGLPVVGANYGALEGPASDLPMDWGTLVPLWFFLGKKKSRKIIVVTPCRGIPLEVNYEFGKVIAREAEKTGRKVAFVASADQAHAHSKSGPYGYSETASEYDRIVVDAIKSNHLASIMKMEPSFVEDAKPDSLWQMTMLAGALEIVPMKGELVSYQVPTYFGMICAGYSRTESSVLG